MGLTRIDEGIWVASAPLSFMGWQFGTRMTVVRLADGTLFVHSPTPLTDELKTEVAALGPVGHIVAPSLYHHLYAGDWKSAHPEAKLHGASGLAQKRTDLQLDALLGDVPDAAWRGEIDSLAIEGNAMEETIFLHRPSRTLIASDLVMNFTTSDHWWTRTYLKAAGVYGKTGLSRLLRFAFVDKKKGRASIDRALEWDFDRIIIAHGEPILSDGQTALRDTYAWLKS